MPAKRRTEVPAAIFFVSSTPLHRAMGGGQQAWGLLGIGHPPHQVIPPCAAENFAHKRHQFAGRRRLPVRPLRVTWFVFVANDASNPQLGGRGGGGQVLCLVGLSRTPCAGPTTTMTATQRKKRHIHLFNTDPVVHAHGLGRRRHECGPARTRHTHLLHAHARLGPQRRHHAIRGRVGHGVHRPLRRGARLPCTVERRAPALARLTGPPRPSGRSVAHPRPLGGVPAGPFPPSPRAHART